MKAPDPFIPSKMPGVGLEPTCLTATDLKSIVATNYTTRAKYIQSLVGFDSRLKTTAGILLTRLSLAPLGASRQSPSEPAARET